MKGQARAKFETKSPVRAWSKITIAINRRENWIQFSRIVLQTHRLQTLDISVMNKIQRLTVTVQQRDTGNVKAVRSVTRSAMVYLCKLRPRDNSVRMSPLLQRCRIQSLASLWYTEMIDTRPLWVAVQGLIRPTPYTYMGSLYLLLNPSKYTAIQCR
jgi:hypothetical protein